MFLLLSLLVLPETFDHCKSAKREYDGVVAQESKFSSGIVIKKAS